MFKSWRTTVAGVIGFLVAAGPAFIAYLDGDPNTVPDWNLILVGLGLGGVGVAARDNGVSSEEARE